MSEGPAWTGATVIELDGEVARLRAVLGYCPRCIAVLDLGGKLSGFNRRFAELFDSSPPAIGQSITELFEADAELLESVVVAARHDDRSAALLSLRTADGQRLVELFAATLPGEDALVGIVLAGDDCTARAHDEAERTSFSFDITKHNARAAYDLAHASIAHDLANAVGVAVLAVEGILKWQAFETPRARDARSECAREADDALKLAMELIGRARRRPILPSASAARADVQQVGERVVRLMRPRTTQTRVRLQCDLPVAISVSVNDTELTQVLTNLVTNAIHAVEDAKRPGTVRLWAEEDAVTRVARIHVRDDGVGIAPSRLQSMFEPYETDRADLGGTGLGLAIVKRIVEGAGGHVHVASTPGDGTDMVIEFPAAAVPSARPETA